MLNIIGSTFIHLIRTDLKYDFDNLELAFVARENGEFSADEIKMLRLAITNDFNVVQRVKVSDEIVLKVLRFAKIISKM